jgi:hypothetical protein
MRKLLIFLPIIHFPALQTLHWKGAIAEICVMSSTLVLSIEEGRHFASLCALLGSSREKQYK